MMKRLLGLLVLLGVLLIPAQGWLETDVRHGVSPKFPVPTSGSYCVNIVGQYTNRDQLTVAGVTTVKWQSDKNAKRQNEMLGLRSAFIDWFIKEWMRQGGSREQALTHLQAIVDHYRNQPSLPDPQSGFATSAKHCGG